MDPSCLVSTVQTAGGGVMVWGIFSWHTLGPLVPIEHHLNATAYLSIVSDHIHPFMTTVYSSSDGFFQQDNAPCHKAQIISDWFLEHENEFTLLKWPPQSPDLNPIEHLWDVVKREICIMTNLQQLSDAIMSIWTKISEECFQRLIESMLKRIKAILQAKGVLYMLFFCTSHCLLHILLFFAHLIVLHFFISLHILLLFLLFLPYVCPCVMLLIQFVFLLFCTVH